MYANQLKRGSALSVEQILIALIAAGVVSSLIWSMVNGKTEPAEVAKQGWGDFPNAVMNGLMNGGQQESKPLIQLPEVKLPDWKLPQLNLPQLPQPQPNYGAYQPEMRYLQPPCPGEYQIDRNLYGPDEIYCIY